MNGRGFDPLLGRFLSVDPFIQSPTNTQSINPYSYIFNNPLSGTDPTGYSSIQGDKDYMTRDTSGCFLGGPCRLSAGDKVKTKSGDNNGQNGVNKPSILITTSGKPKVLKITIRHGKDFVYGDSTSGVGATTSDGVSATGVVTGLVEKADTHPIWVGKNGQVKVNSPNYSGNQYNGSKAGQIAKVKEIAKKFGIPLAVVSVYLRGFQLPDELAKMRANGASQQDITLQKVDAVMDISMAGVGLLGLPGFTVSVGYTAVDYSADSNASKAFVNGIQNIPVPSIPKIPDGPGGMKTFMHRLLSVPEFNIGQ
jgi:hypothetical protein